MAEPREISGRPLPSVLEQQLQQRQQQQQQQQEQHRTEDPPAKATFQSKDKRRKRLLTSLNGAIAETKPVLSRRRPGSTNKSTATPQADDFRTAQQSTVSSRAISSTMSAVHYTRTGRVSKAKKGLKVHDCDCGRSYTRAEHLRRHQRNHAQEGTLLCRYSGCDKTFYRPDLLQRHEERHNEVGHSSRRHSTCSTDYSAHTSPTCMTTALSIGPVVTLPPADTYSAQQALSPQQEITTFSRYNSNLFRTPQLPRTPKTAPSNPSNHVFRSSPSFISSPNDPKLQTLASYQSRHSISGPIIVDGNMTTGVPWHDSFAPSPYSCSSGYASPIPVPEYSHMYATPPYGPGMVRTRASSNASFVGPWAQNSQSPTPSIPNLHYSWSSDEKNVVASSFPYLAASYPTASMPMQTCMDTMEQYGHFGPNDAVQLDHQEGAQLFPREQYGTSQIAHTYQFEQYLNNYWRLFHPTFPIIHRFTFASLEPSSMLFAAMVSIGAQYSNRTCDKRKAMELHSQCVKLLLKREQSTMSGCDRLCDFQAIFLVEIFALFRARRCTKTLSPQFVTMYSKLAGVRAYDRSTIQGLVTFNSPSDDNVQGCWTHWTRLYAWQHLIFSCCILECQQNTLHARRSETIFRYLNKDPLLPAHKSLWDAMSVQEWAVAFQTNLSMPKTVLEASGSLIAERYDTFQSAVLITIHYNSNGSITLMDASLEDLLEDSSMIRYQILTSRLSQLAPIRALLAVFGESWVLGTKVNSHPEFFTLENTLRVWTEQLWPCHTKSNQQSTVEALHTSVTILQLSLSEQEPFILGIGNELGLFVAALVVWAATIAAGTRLSGTRISSQRSQSTQVSPPIAISTRKYHHPCSIVPNNSSPSNRLYSVPEPHEDFQFSSALSVSLDKMSSMSHTEIASDTSRFLNNAINDIDNLNISHCHIGCVSIFLWVKIYLCGMPLKQQASASSDLVLGGDENGELAQIILEQIERMFNRGWEGWGI